MMRLDHLPNQRKDEKIELFLRRHWLAVVSILIGFTALVGLPLTVGYLFSPQLDLVMSHPIFGPVLVVVGSMYFMAAWLFAFIEFTDYYLDVWIVTNERIINIEQEGLFHRTASELHLTAVQDATSDVRGIIRTLLDYGNVQIQTAGEKGRFVFKNISRPERIKEKILLLVEEDKKKHGGHAGLTENHPAGPLKKAKSKNAE